MRMMNEMNDLLLAVFFGVAVGGLIGFMSCKWCCINLSNCNQRLRKDRVDADVYNASECSGYEDDN